MATQGYFDTTIGVSGTPIEIPTFTTLMGNWVTWTENQSVLSLDNQGETGPAAVGAMCLQVAQDYLQNFFPLFNPAPPDATMTTAVAFQGRIVFEAGLVPPQQWNPKTFSNNGLDTIAQCVAAAQAAQQPAQPAPPTNFIGPSYVVNGVTMYTLAAGVSASGFQSGVTYPNAADGNSYVAHVSNFVGMGAQVWFSLVAKGN